ncbi:peptide ABC transporter substrate-binding protein [Brevibacillus reuszeri]|uniref:peptide ABC transporter substrate-binding protein n=1 Tax=Brevibacillus reuszeri TaxID=54915 RepID=UPI0028A0915A|nr:peptide ABC transporter substrate-binding protein [Brevibacillus reuszeri]
MRKSLFVLVCFILVLGASLTGCGNQKEEATPTANNDKKNSTEPKVLNWNLHAEPPTADPGLAFDTTAMAIAKALFDGLTRTGEDGKPHESVAEKIDISPDLKTYTFTLRDTKWSNGDPLTAHDFEFAWKRVLDPKTAAQAAFLMYYIKNAEKANKGQSSLDEIGVKAIDDRTLQVTLENPTPFFIELTAHTVYLPVHKKTVESDQSWAAEAKTLIGNGPFKIEGWDHKNKMILAKNENYWDKSAVKLDKINFSMVEDENTELSMYENGDIDWAGSPMSFLPTDAMPALKESGKLTSQPFAATYWFAFNVEKVPFTNAKIRKAFAYAINRQTIVDNVLQGGQQPALGVLPPTMALKADGYFPDNDTETAKTLLAEGMKELGISTLPPITLLFNTAEIQKKVAEAAQDQWRKNLGVEVKLENQELKVYLQNMAQGNFQVGRLGWSGAFNDPINFLELFKEKNVPNNAPKWENPEYIELLNRSGIEPDPAKRKQLLAQAEQILMNEMPVAPVYYYTYSFVHNPKVKGVLIDGLGKVDWKWADKE